ncbi:MAG TPA: hypothetical protein VK599_11320 [Streptosporangiaceae bacterium]|nr:hypothetical protein [Streptosporangiaceae bacterium]
MSVLDIQRRGQQIGRLRMGEQVGTGQAGKDGKEKMRPVRRSTWRLTTGSRHMADSAARHYGSEALPWNGQWEVDTKLSEITVVVPPRDAVISQNYEMWNAGGCVRRCDSQNEQISGSACLCPHAEDPSDAEEAARAALRRADMARKNPPQACHLITRVSFMIPDLPGLGVFRLDTSSYYAAVEIGDAAMLMQVARDQGVFLAAILRIDQRQRVAGGQTKKYPVPVLEILSTFRQIVGGELAAGGVAAQLSQAPGGQRKAIAGTPVPPAPGDPAGGDDDGAAEVVDAEIVDEWLDARLAAARALATEEQGRALWRESAARANAGECDPGAAALVQAAITARLADLRSGPAAALDPEDPWAVKVEGLDSALDAGDALGELEGLRGAGAVDPDRAARVRAAILLRFPQAAA